ncbi:methyltransferase domain-containing protein [Dokdonia sp.]|uniref:methyltransferase domain-containing protein n=1 Tax=Dokdonia sp. TaxID=2024995 RepID=UPI0032640CB9
MEFNDEYWENRYLENTTRWDLGEISTPIKEYIDQLEDKTLKILIPGGGNSHEAEYLIRQGFKQVYVIDIASTPLQNIKKRVPSFPPSQLIQGDFFDLNLTFDLIIEQTFFCALTPNLRPAYVKKMNNLLTTKGILVGLLFNAPLYEDHPPFGGNIEEYRSLFEPYFTINSMDPATNSVESRTGRELFIHMHKKNKHLSV